MAEVIFGMLPIALGVACLLRWRDMVWGSESKVAREGAFDVEPFSWRFRLLSLPFIALTFIIVGLLISSLPWQLYMAAEVLGHLILLGGGLSVLTSAYAAVPALPLPRFLLQERPHAREASPGGELQGQHSGVYDDPARGVRIVPRTVRTTVTGPVMINGRTPVMRYLPPLLLLLPCGAITLLLTITGGGTAPIILFAAPSLICVVMMMMRTRTMMRGFGLRIDSKGITDYSSWQRTRFLPWPMVLAVTEYGHNVYASIDTDLPIYRSLPLLTRAAIRNHHRKACISTRFLDISPTELGGMLSRENLLCSAPEDLSPSELAAYRETIMTIFAHGVPESTTRHPEHFYAWILAIFASPDA